MKFEAIVTYVAKKRQTISLVTKDRLTRSQLTDRFLRTISYVFGVFAETNSTRIILSNESTIDIYDSEWVKSYPNIKTVKVDDEDEQEHSKQQPSAK